MPYFKSWIFIITFSLRNLLLYNYLNYPLLTSLIIIKNVNYKTNILFKNSNLILLFQIDTNYLIHKIDTCKKYLTRLQTLYSLYLDEMRASREADVQWSWLQRSCIDDHYGMCDESKRSKVYNYDGVSNLVL